MHYCNVEKLMTKEKITQSMDYKYYERLTKTYLAFWGLIAIIGAFLVVFCIMPGEDIFVAVAIGLAPALATGLLVFVPMIVYCIVCKNKLCRNLPDYVECECVLDKPHLTIGRNKSVYFTVQVSLPDGTQNVDTNAMFGGGLMSVYLLEDYNNKNMHAAYNTTTGKIVLWDVR